MDAPLDLVVSLVWLAVIVAMDVLTVRIEKRRQREIRTIYVSPTGLFNSELGLVEVPDPAKRVETMRQMLSRLTYDFTSMDMPRDGFDCQYVVSSDEFKPARAAAQDSAPQSA